MTSREHETDSNKHPRAFTLIDSNACWHAELRIPKDKPQKGVRVEQDPHGM